MAYRRDGPDPLCPTAMVRDLVPQVVLASPHTMLSVTILRLNRSAFICFLEEMGTGIRKESYRGFYGRRDPVQVPLC